MSSYEIYPSSPKALDRMKTRRNAENETERRISKYPFEALEVEQSFVVPVSKLEKTQASLRTQASTVGKILGRKFIVLWHSEFEICEVARIS